MSYFVKGDSSLWVVGKDYQGELSIGGGWYREGLAPQEETLLPSVGMKLRYSYIHMKVTGNVAFVSSGTLRTLILKTDFSFL